MTGPILTPAQEDIVFDGPRKIDFRPARVWSAPGWEDSRVVIALDGLGLRPRDTAAAGFTLQELFVTMPALSGDERFDCRYLSRLVPSVDNHLGIEGEFAPQPVARNTPVARRAWSRTSGGDYGLTWRRFNTTLKTIGRNVIGLQVSYVFDRFTIEKVYNVSIAQLHAYMTEVERNGQPMLKFVQLEVLDL